MMVLSTVTGPAMDWLEPGIRNSNLLPVKATGEVRLRSVVSCGMEGSTSTPMRSVFALGLGIVALTDDGVDDALQLGAEEDGDDGRRRFLRAKTVIVAREGDRAAQQLLILVHALDKGGEEEQEHGVLAGRFAGGEQILACVGRERPVDVLTGAVDTGKGLFMQQADHAVPLGDLLHRLHDELVLVAGGVRVAVDGGHLVLTGGDLVVLGLGEHAELPQLLVQLLHKGRHTRADDAEVVVVQLLTLGRLAAEEGAAAQPQVLTLEV